jgi:hypothetical protein
VDSLGNIIVADRENHVIRKINSIGHVTVIAGSVSVSGLGDGQGTDAKFNRPNGLTIDSLGNVFVVDLGNSVIRKVNASGYVTTIAGTPGQSGVQDGPALSALFTNIYWITIDSLGNLFLTGDDKIRMIFKGASHYFSLEIRVVSESFSVLKWQPFCDRYWKLCYS